MSGKSLVGPTRRQARLYEPRLTANVTEHSRYGRPFQMPEGHLLRPRLGLF